MFKNFDEFFAAVSSSNNYNSFTKNHFGKTNDYISSAIDGAKVGLSSAELFYLAKGVKPDVLNKANVAVSSLAIVAGDSTYLSDNITGSPLTNEKREEIAKMVNAGVPYEQVRQNIYDKRDFELKEIQNPDAKISTTGHSQGGALA